MARQTQSATLHKHTQTWRPPWMSRATRRRMFATLSTWVRARRPVCDAPPHDKDQEASASSTYSIAPASCAAGTTEAWAPKQGSRYERHTNNRPVQVRPRPKDPARLAETRTPAALTTRRTRGPCWSSASWTLSLAGRQRAPRHCPPYSLRSTQPRQRRMCSSSTTTAAACGCRAKQARCAHNAMYDHMAIVGCMGQRRACALHIPTHEPRQPRQLAVWKPKEPPAKAGPTPVGPRPGRLGPGAAGAKRRRSRGLRRRSRARGAAELGWARRVGARCTWRGLTAACVVVTRRGRRLGHCGH